MESEGVSTGILFYPSAIHVMVSCQEKGRKRA